MQVAAWRWRKVHDCASACCARYTPARGEECHGHWPLKRPMLTNPSTPSRRAESRGSGSVQVWSWCGQDGRCGLHGAYDQPPLGHSSAYVQRLACRFGQPGLPGEGGVGSVAWPAAPHAQRMGAPAWKAGTGKHNPRPTPFFSGSCMRALWTGGRFRGAAAQLPCVCMSYRMHGRAESSRRPIIHLLQRRGTRDLRLGIKRRTSNIKRALSRPSAEAL